VLPEEPLAWLALPEDAPLPDDPPPLPEEPVREPLPEACSAAAACCPFGCWPCSACRASSSWRSAFL
jgi:hypothetical protein